MVSSTTPRFGPRWPPVRDRLSMRRFRIAAASAGSCSSVRFFTSAGPVDVRQGVRVGGVGCVVQGILGGKWFVQRSRIFFSPARSAGTPGAGLEVLEHDLPVSCGLPDRLDPRAGRLDARRQSAQSTGSGLVIADQLVEGHLYLRPSPAQCPPAARAPPRISRIGHGASGLRAHCHGWGCGCWILAGHGKGGASGAVHCPDGSRQRNDREMETGAKAFLPAGGGPEHSRSGRRHAPPVKKYIGVSAASRVL